MIEHMNIYANISRCMEIFSRFRNKEYALLLHVFVYASHLRKLISEYPWFDQEPWIQNALLEASLMKARTLVDFLNEPKNLKSDLNAIEFVAGWQSDSGKFDVFKELVNKHVAHLTKERYVVSSSGSFEDGEYVLDQLNLVILDFNKFELQLGIKNKRLLNKLREDSDCY